MTDAPPPARTSAPRGDGDDARHFALLAHRLGGATALAEVHDAAVVAARDLLDVEVAAVARLEQDDQWEDLALSAAEIFTRSTPDGVPDLVEMGLLSEEQAAQPLEDLSLGQRRRVSLGIILSSPPDLLLLDEPTNHLSLALAEELEEALLDFAGTVIVTSHDRWVRRQWRRRLEHKDGRAKVLALSTLWTGELWRDRN